MTGRAGEAAPSGVPAVIRESLQGKYAGFASRFTAFAVDVGVSLAVFLLALAAVSFAARVLTGRDIAWNKGDIWVIVAYAIWAFIYFAHSWAASGRTVGMALFGVRVVRDDGTDVSGRRAVVRTLALPLSFLFLGLGFVGILLGDRRRALHDVIAGTAVIYSWDARAARLRFLSRGLSRSRLLPVPGLYPAGSVGWSGVASAFSTGIRVPATLTTRSGTLTSRTPLS